MLRFPDGCSRHFGGEGFDAGLQHATGVSGSTDPDCLQNNVVSPG
jgi:hypothetical protein